MECGTIKCKQCKVTKSLISLTTRLYFLCCVVTEATIKQYKSLVAVKITASCIMVELENC